jgi:hypothetical protein
MRREAISFTTDDVSGSISYAIPCCTM